MLRGASRRYMDELQCWLVIIVKCWLVFFCHPQQPEQTNDQANAYCQLARFACAADWRGYLARHDIVHLTDVG